MSADRHETGLKVRREVLGDAHVERAETAKTESCGSNFWLQHFGHSAVSLPKTRASNWWLHSLQAYSKIGIDLSQDPAEKHSILK